jgi:hypothetical protein
MRRLLQSIIYNRKVYDRPQDEWTCGRAAEGCPCIYGPGKKGECRATSQCLPAKKGDRWVCTRAISLGATCEPGPLPDGSCGCPVPPCRPVRSLRAERGRLTWLMVSLALGVVILAVWGETRADWSNPGPLTDGHAMSAQRCADCHLEPAGIALSGAARQRQHDQLCIKCHDLGPNASSPHGAPAAELLALARAEKPPTGARPFVLAAAALTGRPSEPACAACHREHQGHAADLKHMGNQQCQTCHQSQFTSLAQGHPEFTSYPYVRRTRIEFDHATHFQKHFTDTRLAAPGPTSCAQCHEPAMDGRLMLVRSFEQTCIQCHGAQIEGSGRASAKGLEFFRLPGLDVAALAAAGQDIGEWPAYCDGAITPFMRWMLEGDETARAALTVLGPLNLADLSRATPAQKAAAAQLVWGIKGLLADLVTQGQQTILRRLGPPPAGGAAPARSTGQFSADVALAAQQAWLPHLLAEVAAHRRGEKLAAPAPVVSAKAAETAPVAAASSAAASDDLLSDPVPVVENKSASATAVPVAAPATLAFAEADERVAQGGWYRQDESYTIHYRPGGHADTFLTAWLAGTAGNAAPTAQAIFTQLSSDHAPGVCMKCHTVDRTAGGTVVNWSPAKPKPGLRPFTTFKHDAHFSLMGDQGCATCHTLDVTANYAGSFGPNHDPAVFHSNFAPLSKDICAACHQPAKAGDSCQQCHNYHTGEMQNLRVRAAEFHVAPEAAHPPGSSQKL